MRAALALALVVSGCGCASKPLPNPQVPKIEEYTVPLLKQDGTVDTLTVEDVRQDGTRILFCKEQAQYLMCLVNENGVAAWAMAPFAPDPNEQT